MKFKKDGKVYVDMVAGVYDCCDGLESCSECKLHKKTGGLLRSCLTYARLHPKEVARVLGYEVIEDDTPDIHEAVEKYGENVKPDVVNRPAHYTSGGIECINAMQAAFGVEAVKDFCLCNAFKYLWRHRNKNGVEDLKKAQWYLGRLIAEMEVEE